MEINFAIECRRDSNRPLRLTADNEKTQYTQHRPLVRWKRPIYSMVTQVFVQELNVCGEEHILSRKLVEIYATTQFGMLDKENSTPLLRKLFESNECFTLSFQTPCNSRVLKHWFVSIKPKCN